MNTDMKKIIDLHKIDLRMLEIEEDKGELPGLISEQEEKISNLNDSLIESKNKINSLDKNIHNYNSQSTDLLSKIEKYNNQIYSVKNNKEYEALLKEIDFLKTENNELKERLSNESKEKESTREWIFKKGWI